MASFVISALGDDRAGLVDKLAGVITEHGGNWGQSHMTQLAGKFAGVVLVEVPSDRTESFMEALESLDRTGVLHLSVERGRDVSPPRAAIEIRIVGNDHPGIVHEVSHLLATRGVSIDDLQTETMSAPMAGGRLFEAVATLRLPANVTSEEIVADLEGLATDLMVDVELLDEESS